MTEAYSLDSEAFSKLASIGRRVSEMAVPKSQQVQLKLTKDLPVAHTCIKKQKSIEVCTTILSNKYNVSIRRSCVLHACCKNGHALLDLYCVVHEPLVHFQLLAVYQYLKRGTENIVSRPLIHYLKYVGNA
jgi:hypothetical protein